jgi:hypothetical protein
VAAGPGWVSVGCLQLPPHEMAAGCSLPPLQKAVGVFGFFFFFVFQLVILIL